MSWLTSPSSATAQQQAPAGVLRPHGLRAIMASLAERARDDDDDFDVRPRTAYDHLSIGVALDDILNFDNDWWTNDTAMHTTNTLEEELAVWDILDLDADGEGDGGESGDGEADRVGGAHSDDVMNAVLGL